MKHIIADLPLSKLKDQKYFPEFRLKNLQITKRNLKEAVNEDDLIVQTISNVNDIDRITNILSKRLREWYSLYYPELSRKITEHEIFVNSILSEKKAKNSFGADLKEEDLNQIKLLAKQTQDLFALRNKHEKYLENIMKDYCPNLLTIAGTTLGAKLLLLAKGLKRLALLPASTVQLLGAEKALFRHLRLKTKSPKHGILIHHPLVQNSERNMRGKAARVLADKIVLCARIDYFKGEFKANEYKKELEEKLK